MADQRARWDENRRRRGLSGDPVLLDSLPETVDPMRVSSPGLCGGQINRRGFLCSGIAFAMASTSGRGGRIASAGGDDEESYVVEASYYEKLPHKKIRCLLCPRECVIDESERGYCGVRENREGTYYTLVHSRLCTFHVDPIEKKPLFHFHPGTRSFSIATAGCNVNCRFCQNWEISQVRPEQVRSYHAPPGTVTATARKQKCASIAYTYSEPVIFFEYMRDVARSAREQGVKSVVVTGGYISHEPLKELCGQVDGIKVDLKAFSEKYYQDVVNGELRPVLDGLVTMCEAGVWTEIVYLVVPTMNDSEKELTNLARWVKQNLGSDVPIHFSRFYPQYLMKNLPPTPVTTLERAKAISDAEGLNYVYIGNVPGHDAENTRCPGCGEIVVERKGYTIRGIQLTKGLCSLCKHPVAGLWGA